jgi:hypothetical protein
MSEKIQVVDAGRKLDHAAWFVKINVEKIVDERGEPDTWRLMVKRPGDEVPYFAQRYTYNPTTKKISWNITSTDSARSSAQCQIIWIKGEKVVHGDIYQVKFGNSLGVASEETPFSVDIRLISEQFSGMINSFTSRIENEINSKESDLYTTINTNMGFVNSYFDNITNNVNSLSVDQGNMWNRISNTEDAVSDLQTEVGIVENDVENAQQTADFAVSETKRIQNIVTNPNISSEYELRTINAQGEVNGRYLYYRYGSLEVDKTYTFSADIVESPLPSTIVANIGTSTGGTNVTTLAENVFTIEAGATGRISRTFTSENEGFLFFTGTIAGAPNGRQILDNIQIEVGETATEYQKYGTSKVVDTVARNSIEQLQKELRTCASKYLHGNILSVSDGGYMGGLPQSDQNKIPAFLNAKKNGFDWIKVRIRKTLDGKIVVASSEKANTATQTNVNISSVNYSDILEDERPELLVDVINFCNVYGLGIAVHFRYESTAEDRTYIRNQFRTKRIDHANCSEDISNLVGMRALEPDCQIVYFIDNQPTAATIRSSSAYADFYTLSQQGNTCISFPTSGHLIDQDYIDSLNELGISFALGTNETRQSIQTYIKYSSMLFSTRSKLEDFIEDL